VSKDTNMLVQAYTAYVKPLLEYASSVWSPHSVGLINRLSQFNGDLLSGSHAVTN